MDILVAFFAGMATGVIFGIIIMAFSIAMGNSRDEIN